MITKIKYENPSVVGDFIVEELEDTQINVPEYCINLHKNVLCNSHDCNGEHCKIWVEINGEYILAGVID